MTLEEKVGQLCQANGLNAIPTGPPKQLVANSSLFKLVQDGRLGSILNEISPATINEFQRLAVEESRLGVPLVFARDVIHGFRTIFPVPLGQAASWNPELVEEACAVAAREARSVGIAWTFAPMMDIARDPRWGRIVEGYGEDPHLASVMAAASVRGFQGDDLSDPQHIAACAKHFVGYGAVEGGRDYNTTMISDSTLHNIYLPSFRSAVDAGVATVMCAFTDLNGIPMNAHKHLLRDVLRNDWHFQGFVVSDWGTPSELSVHGVAADEREATLLSVNAGLSMEMASQNYQTHLADLVRSGTVAESVVDSLVREILRVKFRLGLFDHPYVDTTAPSPLLASDHLELARQLARQSVVLLKNEKDTLPLAPEKIKRIAVIGPLADAPADQLGCWIPDGKAEDSQTPLAALRKAAGKGIEIIYAQGLKDGLDRSDAGFGEARATAEQADVVLLFVGEPASITGEAHCRALLDLPGSQRQLVEMIAKLGKPTVMIVQAGRPLTIGRELAQVDSVLYSLHAGTMTGPALADLLWGVESPSGKLPFTMVKSVGQIPIYYNRVHLGRPSPPYEFPKDSAVSDAFDLTQGNTSNYLDLGPYPMFPFGYGLSYTTFEYGKAELSTTKLRPGQTLAVRVPVTNSGTRSGDEIVQLYVRDMVGSIARPIRELKGFRRVHLEPGETQVVELALPTDSLAFYNNEEQRLLEPGKFRIYVGGNSLAPKVGEFELVD
jgi:beta-glucosidase